MSGLHALRIGHGVDVHAFAAGTDRPLLLAGIQIPAAPPLAGHSDADVVLHAIADAVLGAAGAGDLGSMVGVDRPETAGADSATFVRAALRTAGERGWSPVNLDCTVVCQRPRLQPHVPAMVDSVAALLGLPADAVAIKATTTDHMGFLGRGEGIACLAVLLLSR